MKAVGFAETQTEKAIKYLEIEQANVDTAKLDHAIALLEAQLKQKAEASKLPKPPAEKKKCAGGCGFWGNEDQDFYCSVCHKKKMCGIKPVASDKPEKCIKECGFFGAKKFNGMCSVCFEKEAKSTGDWKCKFKKAMLKIKAVRAFRSAPRLVQTNKKRCWQCKRKVGLLGIECKCGFIFCGKHRYADEHMCRFDHRHAHKKKLRKDNQQILSKKFEKVDD